MSVIKPQGLGDLVIGTRRHAGGTGHVGVLRHGKTIVAECGHDHPNRDTDTRTSGTSARTCMRMLVYATQNEAYADDLAARIENAWRSLGSRGFHVAASTIEKAKAVAPIEVAAFRATVAQVTALLAESASRCRAAQT